MLVAERVVVVGGDAAGMTVASQLRRRRPDRSDVEIVVLERTRWVSYSACGIPYWVAGDVDGPDGLVARTPEEHRRRGIDVRLHSEVTAIDLAARSLQVAGDGAVGPVGFDTLVLATGATPKRPDVPGVEAALGVQTLADGQRALDRLGRLGGRPARAVVVGGGYIGVEMAEAMVRRGLSVTLVDRRPEPMGGLDPDMGRLVREAMTGLGIDVHPGCELTGVETDADGNARRVLTTEGSYDADIVVLGLGVRANVDLAAAAGLPVGEVGGLVTDDRQHVRDDVWSAGDCTQVRDRITGRQRYVPLGTHANKQGRVLGANLAGVPMRFPGVVGTAITKVCDLEVGRTGLTSAQATAAGFDVATRSVVATSRAGYFPGAAPMTVKAIADRASGRLLGVQIVGRDGAGKRIDTAALALWSELTADELAMTDLAYAPPFSPVWDPVQSACRALAEDLAR